MPNLREVQNQLLLAHDAGDINDEEFLLLYDINNPSNLYLPYWKYPKFYLEDMNDDECYSELRFQKEHIARLLAVFGLPEQLTCYNGVVCDSTEALCILLKRFAYPCRYQDIIHRFARPVPQLCMISNSVMDFIFENWNHLLTSFEQNWLSPENLEVFCEKVHEKGAPLDNCWGSLKRAICRPGEHQRLMYNGHKRIHGIKFQSLVTPNGLIANLFGPVEGRRHRDSGMLADSNLLPLLQRHSIGHNLRPLCIYGDPAYPLRVHLQAGFKGAHLTEEEKLWNKNMSAVRVSVEWVFGDIVNYFRFLDFKKNLKIGLSAVGKMYITCALLHNARTCLYGNVTSKEFDCQPPNLEDYFIQNNN